MHHSGSSKNPLVHALVDKISSHHKAARGEACSQLATHIRHNPQDAQIRVGGSPILHIACDINNPTLIDACLINEGIANKSFNGTYPIHCLVRSSVHDYPLHLDALVAAGADINVRSSSGTTPLLIAASCSGKAYRPGLVQRLIDLGADPNIANDQGDTPLFNSMRYTTFADTKALLLAGASVQAINPIGVTPVFCTTTADQMELLIAHGANISEINRFGKTPLDSAIGALNVDTIATLLRHRAPLENCHRFIDEQNAGSFTTAWHFVESELDEPYKINGLVALMCHANPLTAWAGNQLTHLGSEC